MIDPDVVATNLSEGGWDIERIDVSHDFASEHYTVRLFLSGNREVGQRFSRVQLADSEASPTLVVIEALAQTLEQHMRKAAE